MLFKTTLLFCTLINFAALAANDAPVEVPEWVLLQTELVEKQAIIRSKQGEIAKLVEAKKALPNNSVELNNLMAEYKKKHRELENLKLDLNEAYHRWIFRFPERGRNAEDIKPMPQQTLQQLEEAITIDGVLTRSLTTMRKHLKAVPQTSRQKPSKAPESSVEEAPPIIIKK